MAIDLNHVRKQRGRLLRELRERNGLRLPAAAALIGVSRTRLDAIERGRGRMSFSKLLAAIDAFGADSTEAGFLFAFDLLERVAMQPENLQAVFDRVSAGNGGPLAAMTEIGASAGHGPDCQAEGFSAERAGDLQGRHKRAIG